MKKSKELMHKAADLIKQALEAAENGEIEKAEELEEEAKQVEAQAQKVKVLEEKQKAMAEPVMPAPLPTGDGGDTLLQPDSPNGDGGDPEQDFHKSVNYLRYANVKWDNLSVDELCNFKAMTELYGEDYRKVNNDQNLAFERCLRAKGYPDPADDRVLRKLYWPIRHTTDMLKVGMSVDRVKATMVEGVDVLGGYAVPPERSEMILQRTMGMTAVRQAGALVVQTSSKMIEWLKVTGSGNQYPSSLRGAYGSEIQSPTAKTLTVGLLQIPVHVYTYKTPFSTSILEDADNIVMVFERQVSETLAMDEDRDFLVGDGANKPRGILPGQANPDGLTEVVTGDADDVTMDGLKKLRRGIASQYRINGRSSFVGNNQTGEDIELFQDGSGRYYFDALSPGDEFMGGRWFESESLPDPASAAYPLVFGDFSGYAIVERLGLSIQRYNDSNTGPNVVEFHIRRRIGGRVVEPWKFAVAKCSVS